MSKLLNRKRKAQRHKERAKKIAIELVEREECFPWLNGRRSTDPRYPLTRRITFIFSRLSLPQSGQTKPDSVALISLVDLHT